MEEAREIKIYKDLDGVIEELLRRKERGENVYCVFNGHTLRSKDITVDSAYLEVTGFTKAEYEEKLAEANRKWKEKERKETEEAIRKIPEWIDRGKRIIKPELHDKWVECVNIRANDLYHGWDLDQALALLELLNSGADMDMVVEELNKQNHSGASYSIVTSMVCTFSERRNEFFRATTRLKEVEPLLTLDKTIDYLIGLQRRGINVFCDFNGHILLSGNITVDKAYLEVMGCTKKEWEAKQKQWHEEYEQEERETKIREAGYKKTVAEQRSKSDGKITKEKVVAGLKFIAEHQDMEQTELIQGLLALGCDFTLEDINQQFPTPKLLFEGMAEGDLACGASVICNVRDSEFGRAFADDKFLSYNESPSVYHFIRVVTGDESYTMDSVVPSGPKF